MPFSSLISYRIFLWDSFLDFNICSWSYFSFFILSKKKSIFSVSKFSNYKFNVFQSMVVNWSFCNCNMFFSFYCSLNWLFKSSIIILYWFTCSSNSDFYIMVSFSIFWLSVNKILRAKIYKATSGSLMNLLFF